MRLLANVVALMHLAFVVFVVTGGILVLRWRRAAWIHVPAALWGAAIALGGWICPLTPLENWLREQGGGTGYTTGFIEHYVLPVLYPVMLTREVQMAAGVLVIVLNALLYGVVFGVMRPSARSRSPLG